MMVWFWILAAPVLTFLSFLIGKYLNKGKGATVEVEKFLMVQTGVLTALAILVALGGTFLTDRSSWVKWTLAGALFAAVGWTGGILFTMVTQQSEKDVDQSVKSWIPGVTNAAWLSLVLLAVCCIVSKLFPAQGSGNINLNMGQVIIVRDRLPLDTTQADAIAKWGTPNFKTESGWAYRTPSGTFVLCFQSANAPAKSISETREVTENAIEAHCK